MESAKLLEAIIDHAIDGIITIDNRGLIESINPAACNLFGYSEEEVIGNNVSILMPEPDQSLHDSYIDNYKRTGHKKIIGIGREVLGRKKDGTTFPFRLAVSEVWYKNRMKAPFYQHGAICDNAARLEIVHISAGACVSISVCIDTILPLLPHTNAFTACTDGIFLR